jgi:hypothetical protein
MSPSSGSYESDGVAERRAQRVLNEKVGDRLVQRSWSAETEVHPGRSAAARGHGRRCERQRRASRRHGPFDSRWAKRPLRIAADRLTIALTGLEEVPTGLIGTPSHALLPRAPSTRL